MAIYNNFFTPLGNFKKIVFDPLGNFYIFSTPLENYRNFLTPLEILRKLFPPSEIVVNRHPLRNSWLVPPRKFTFLDPFGKSRQQGGVDIKWNGPWKIDAVNLDEKIRPLPQVPDRSNDGFKNEEVLDSAKLRGSCT